MLKNLIPQNTKKGIEGIFRHLKPFKRQLVFISLLGLISAAANGFVPYVTGKFFDALIEISAGNSYNQEIPFWIGFLAIWALAQIIANLSDWIMDLKRREVHTHIQTGIQGLGFSWLLRLPLSYHKNIFINEVIDKFDKASWRVAWIFSTVAELSPQFLSILIGIVLVSSINIYLASILLVGVIFYTAVLIKMLAPIASIDEKAHRIWHEAWGDAAMVVHQVESVKQAAAEEYEEKRIKETLIENSFDAWFKNEKFWNNINFFQRIIVFLTQFAIFFVSVFLVGKGVITVGELVSVTGYALMFFGPFVTIGHNWQIIQNGITSASQAEDVFREKPEEYNPPDGKIFDIKGAVEFKNVFFSYGLKQPEILKNVSFKVNQGEVVAFVGESGVGKSTIVSMLSGYYFPVKGAVFIDGADTRKVNLTSLRKQIGVVPQEVALFNDTILANIVYGSFGVKKSDVKRVVTEAHILDFIESLPAKYKTLVGERGVKLSVGQKQRIAIARAMLRNPKILILDEPTSALDLETERYVTESLEKLMVGRTTFIIAHRLSTVRKASKIFVFDKGEIVEVGTHEELMKIEGGKYRRMYELHIGLHD